jgi:alcohol dehydrogenase
VAAATGIDAVAHAVESAGSTKRTDVSRALSRQAWSLLEPAFGRVMHDPADAAARQDMLTGAHVAGAAIENSMLGGRPLAGQSADRVVRRRSTAWPSG